MESPRETIGPIEFTRAGLRLTPMAGKAAILKGWTDIELGESQILAWEKRGVNWGAITGDPLIVLDTDTEEAETWVQSRGIESPVMVRSGHGGTHRWFLKPETVTIIRSKNGMHGIKGLDVKGWHGYIVLPGSIHPETGRRYEFIAGKEFTSLDELPPFDPAWVREIPKEPVGEPRNHFPGVGKMIGGKIQNVRAYIRAIPSVEHQGGSNGLMRVCYVLIEEGYSFPDALAEALSWNDEVPIPAWKPEDVCRALKNAFRRKLGVTIT